jgi:uncharacterized membrane protein
MRAGIVGAVVALAATMGAAQATTYSFTTIDVPGASNTFVTGINNDGELVGFINSGGSTVGFVRAPDGTVTTFTDPAAGGGPINAYGINDGGQVVGPCCVDQAYVRNADGSFVNFGLPGGGPVAAIGINAAGQVVGNAGTNGFLRSADGSTFTTISDGGISAALGINNEGQIVGSVQGQFGFLRQTDGTFATIAFPGKLSTVAADINDAGEIVGFYGNVHNDGFVRFPDGTFISLDDPAAGEVTQITGVNDAGDLAGLYQDPNGVYHGFVATPVPEPEMAGFLLMLLMAMRRIVPHRRRASRKRG